MKHLLSCIFVLTAFAGCSIFSSDKDEAETAAPKEDKASWLSSSLKGEEPSMPVIKITWQRPDEPVTSYVLRYGFEREKLDREVKIPVGELDKEDDPRFGPVYRYRLHGVPEGRALFISLQAANADGVSPPSPVTEVQPEIAPEVVSRRS